MLSRSISRISVAILASAFLIFLAMFEWPLLQLLRSMPREHAIELYCHVDHWRADPSPIERFLRITTHVVAPVGVAVFVALSVTRAGIRWGALSAGASVIVAYVAVHSWNASMCRSWSVIPDVISLYVASALSLLGALAAWLVLRWRPNKSLGRTRAE